MNPFHGLETNQNNAISMKTSQLCCNFRDYKFKMQEVHNVLQANDRKNSVPNHVLAIDIVSILFNNRYS